MEGFWLRVNGVRVRETRNVSGMMVTKSKASKLLKAECLGRIASLFFI